MRVPVFHARWYRGRQWHGLCSVFVSHEHYVLFVRVPSFFFWCLDEDPSPERRGCSARRSSSAVATERVSGGASRVRRRKLKAVAATGLCPRRLLRPLPLCVVTRRGWGMHVVSSATARQRLLAVEPVLWAWRQATWLPFRGGLADVLHTALVWAAPFRAPWSLHRSD